MTIQQLEYIVALDKHRRFVEAAEECGVTQPTLSAMIMKLEEELDVKIFDRSKHPVEPTATGRLLIRQAETALREAGRMREVVASERGSVAGDLSLGIIPTAAPYLLPLFLSRYRKAYPDVRLRISEFPAAEGLERVRTSEIDLMIASMPDDIPAGIATIPLYRERFYAYVSPSYPYRDATFVAGDMPVDNVWVLCQGHCIIKGAGFSFCRRNAAAGAPSHVYDAGSIDTLVRIVDTNGGYTVIPELHLGYLSDEQRANVREIVSPEVHREVSVAIRLDYIRERLLNSVVDIIKTILPPAMLDERIRRFPIKL